MHVSVGTVNSCLQVMEPVSHDLKGLKVTFPKKSLKTAFPSVRLQGFVTLIYCILLP